MDGRHLYLLFTCAYDTLNLKPSPQTEIETNELWNWDVCRVFLGSEFDRIHLYKEFEVSPQGEWIDVDVDRSQPNHERGWFWGCSFKSAARIEAGSRTWYASMRIPFVAIDQRPAVAWECSPGQLLPDPGLGPSSGRVAADHVADVPRTGRLRTACIRESPCHETAVCGISTTAIVLLR